jgi:hypothetical protein
MQARTSFRTPVRTTRVASAVIAVAALAASATGFAAETPNADAVAQNEAALAVSSTYRNANGGGPLTREQVREELRQARESGTLSTYGEAGDTPQVLAAREAFNTAQSETIIAEVIADQQRVLALAEAEVRRAAIEAEAQAQARTLALSEGETLVPEGAAAADSDETEVRIDVIDMQTSATSPANELVIVSLDGGDAASQQARAMHVRRQLGAMGLAQDRIYVEGTDAEGEGEAVAAAEGDVDVAAINAASDASVAAVSEPESETAAVAEGERN